MKFPTKPGTEKVIARDRYRNAVILFRNSTDGASADGSYDLMTDGRVVLTPLLARELARILLQFAEEKS